MKKSAVVVGLIFLMALGFRLFFAFQTPNLDYDAYFNLRQVASIQEQGLPFFEDELSFGGRTLHFIPVFPYILGFFSFFLPLLFTLKLIPNIFAASIVIINYLIAKRITKDENSSLFCAFISAFIPLFIAETFNSVSVYTLVIPLTFLSLYFLMASEKKRYISYFLISTALLAILHPSSFLLVIGLLLYALMRKLEHLSPKREKIESILFFTFFAVWINFILYKKALLAHGASVIWQNIPSSIISLYFSETDILAAIVAIGLIPVLLGIYIIYRYVFREKQREIYMLIGMALACFFLLWPGLLTPDIAFMFLGVILVILFAQGYKLFFDYLEKTKVASFRKWFIIFFVVVFVFSSIIPSLYFANQKVEETIEDIDAFLWIRDNAQEGDVVAASLTEGHVITAIAKRKNVVDSNFLLIKDAEERYADLIEIYSSRYKTVAIPLLNKYDIKYIVLSSVTKAEFGIRDIYYLDEQCFKLVYRGKTRIYESLCKVEEV